jgi:hypothetical protein
MPKQEIRGLISHSIRFPQASLRPLPDERWLPFGCWLNLRAGPNLAMTPSPVDRAPATDCITGVPRSRKINIHVAKIQHVRAKAVEFSRSPRRLAGASWESARTPGHPSPCAAPPNPTPTQTNGEASCELNSGHPKEAAARGIRRVFPWKNSIAIVCRSCGRTPRAFHRGLCQLGRLANRSNRRALFYFFSSAGGRRRRAATARRPHHYSCAPVYARCPGRSARRRQPGTAAWTHRSAPRIS